MYRTELRYGLLAGVTLIGTIYLGVLLNLNPQLAGIPSFMGIFSFIFIVVYTLMSVNKVKPFPNIKETFLSGMVVACCAGLIFGIYSMIYVKYINPQYADKLIADGALHLKKAGSTDADITRWKQSMLSINSPFSQLMSGMGITSTLGAVTSVVAGVLILRRKKQSEIV